MYDYDMVVIGSGPSGRRAAVQFAKLGKSVLVVEKGRRVGGVSVHTGTIPSKTLRETVLNLSGWRERALLRPLLPGQARYRRQRSDRAAAKDPRS
jgi:NAD(P) transhydrogenase